MELVADNPGDRAVHCLIAEHVMIQMGHVLPNLVGVDAAVVNEKLRSVFPDYPIAAKIRVNAEAHASEAIPPNRILIFGSPDPIRAPNMGCMGTVLEVRDGFDESAEPPRYDHPKGSVKGAAPTEELATDKVTP